MAERRSLTLWVHLAPEPTGGLCGPSGSWTHSWTSVGAQGRPKEGDLLEPRGREAKTLLGGRGVGSRRLSQWAREQALISHTRPGIVIWVLRSNVSESLFPI